MKQFGTDLKHWPRRRNGEPIFRDANEAIFYAQLASKDHDVVEEMKEHRAKARRDLQRVRTAKNPNLDKLMNYAVNAQFFRECYEEIERINGEGMKE